MDSCTRGLGGAPRGAPFQEHLPTRRTLTSEGSEAGRPTVPLCTSGGTTPSPDTQRGQGAPATRGQENWLAGQELRCGPGRRRVRNTRDDWAPCCPQAQAAPLAAKRVGHVEVLAAQGWSQRQSVRKRVRRGGPSVSRAQGRAGCGRATPGSEDFEGTVLHGAGTGQSRGATLWAVPTAVPTPHGEHCPQDARVRTLPATSSRRLEKVRTDVRRPGRVRGQFPCAAAQQPRAPAHSSSGGAGALCTPCSSEHVHAALARHATPAPSAQSLPGPAAPHPPRCRSGAPASRRCCSSRSAAGAPPSCGPCASASTARPPRAGRCCAP